jgi:hypothetical protein
MMLLSLLFAGAFALHDFDDDPTQSENDQNAANRVPREQPVQEFRPAADAFIIGDPPPERGPPDPIIDPFPGPSPAPFPRLTPPPAPTIARHVPLHSRIREARKQIGLIAPIVFTTLVAIAIYKLGPLFITLAEGKESGLTDV